MQVIPIHDGNNKKGKEHTNLCAHKLNILLFNAQINHPTCFIIIAVHFYAYNIP